MKTHLNISVLMTAYNAERYLAESIDSILAQTFSDFELLILDDGSTDATSKILREYAAKDARIQVFTHERNKGISAGRNFLVGKASAKYIAWQDADDIALPERLTLQYHYMEAHPEVGMCGGYLEIFDSTGKQTVRRYAEHDADLRAKIFRYMPVAQPVALVRTQVLRSVLPYPNIPAAEDLEMAFRIGAKSKFANVQQVLLRYRDSEVNTTAKKLPAMLKHTFAIRTRYAKNTAYTMSPSDYAHNYLQHLAVVVPKKVVMSLFRIYRAYF